MPPKKQTKAETAKPAAAAPTEGKKGAMLPPPPKAPAKKAAAAAPAPKAPAPKKETKSSKPKAKAAAAAVELSSESDTDSASQTESDFSDLSASDLSQSESDTEEKGTPLTPAQLDEALRGKAAEIKSKQAARRQQEADAAAAEGRAVKRAAPTFSNRGVVYLGHIPYGFFEDAMSSYFGQFGQVTRLRLARNKKTGNSKHYAFIEFVDKETAEIVAETMHGYMMFGQTLQCHVVPNEDVHADTFSGAGRKFRRIPWAKLSKERHNRPRDGPQTEKRVGKLLSKESKKRKQLEALGIDYEFPGYAGDSKREASGEPRAKRARTEGKSDSAAGSGSAGAGDAMDTSAGEGESSAAAAPAEKAGKAKGGAAQAKKPGARKPKAKAAASAS